MTAILERLSRDQVAAYWPVLESYFARVGAKVLGDRTPEDIRARALAGDCLIWTIIDEDHSEPLRAVFSTVMRACGETKVLHIEDLAGDGMTEWLPLLSDLEGHASTAGAARVHIEGRMGWRKTLASHGYRPVRIVLEKEI